jgi:hypothetical protein
MLPVRKEGQVVWTRKELSVRPLTDKECLLLIDRKEYMDMQAKLNAITLNAWRFSPSQQRYEKMQVVAGPVLNFMPIYNGKVLQSESYNMSDNACAVQPQLLAALEEGKVGGGSDRKPTSNAVNGRRRRWRPSSVPGNF